MYFKIVFTELITHYMKRWYGVLKLYFIISLQGRSQDLGGGGGGAYFRFVNLHVAKPCALLGVYI